MASESSNKLQSQADVLNATLSFIRSMSLKCAVDLGIPDAIHRHGRPIPLPALAASLSLPPSKSDSLARLMRVLRHAGFFDMSVDVDGVESYTLTHSSRRLRDKGSLYARMVLDPAMIAPWLHLSEWFHGDARASFETAHGVSLWEYAGRNPGFNDVFNDAMNYDSDLVTGQIVEQCGEVFDGVRTMVDVGGGNGAVARAIAAAFPQLRCVVFDLPHVVEGLAAAERLEYVGGSMFDSIPPAGVLLLKRVLHDYDDEDCLKILRRCIEVVPSKEEGGKLILVEIVLNVVKDNLSGSLETQLFYDMQMMTILGGKERNEQEWRNIFIQAGFTTYKITPVTELLCLIEVYL